MQNSVNFSDVLIVYKQPDEESVEKIVNLLKREGIKPWFVKEIYPWEEWFSHYAEVIKQVTCAAIFIGPKGLRTWSDNEIKALVNYQREVKTLPLITVQLPNVLSDNIPEIIKTQLPLNTWLTFPDKIYTKDSLDLLIDAYPKTVDGHYQLHKLIKIIQRAIITRIERYNYEIEIDIHDAEQYCYLTLPGNGSKAVFSVVNEVIREMKTAQNLEIKLKQSKFKNDETTYTSDLVHTIRQSELIIADCTPVKNSGSPCPSVVYELGMAHALGKPSIILTPNNKLNKQIPICQKKVMPAEIFVEYQSQKINTLDFKKKLRDAVTNSISHLEYNLTDKELEEIHAVRSDLHIIKNNLWPELNNIIKFAFESLKSFKKLMPQSHTFLENINELSKNTDTASKSNDEIFNLRLDSLKKSYSELAEKQDEWEQDFYSGYFQQNEKNIKKAFKFLMNHLREDLREHIMESRKWFNLVFKSEISELKKHNSWIREYSKTDFNCLNNFGPSKDFKHEAEMMDYVLHLVFNHTTRMVDSAMNII